MERCFICPRLQIQNTVVNQAVGEHTKIVLLEIVVLYAHAKLLQGQARQPTISFS